jgi:hypothetical protein
VSAFRTAWLGGPKTQSDSTEDSRRRRFVRQGQRRRGNDASTHILSRADDTNDEEGHRNDDALDARQASNSANAAALMLAALPKRGKMSPAHVIHCEIVVCHAHIIYEVFFDCGKASWTFLFPWTRLNVPLARRSVCGCCKPREMQPFLLSLTAFCALFCRWFVATCASRESCSLPETCPGVVGQEEEVLCHQKQGAPTPISGQSA